ncbi:MAG: 5-bromo-4-chloroindolyl phosphate hydrolysis family protein [Paracoccaceae bacterium]
MAQKYGGKYSPNASTTAKPGAPRPAAEPPAPRAGFGSGVLFVTPFLFLVPAFFSGTSKLFLELAAGAVLILAAWLTREGILAHAAYDARRVARRPAFPRKIAGSITTGIGLAIGTITWAPGIFYPLLFGLAGAALHLFAFGPDPMTDKGAEGIDQFQTDRVARAVDEAEAHLKAMKDAILRAKDRQIEGRVDHFAATARTMFRTIEGNPGDLTSARKYLSVYLMGARDATVKFADIYAQSRDAKARADYEALLTDLETNFATRTEALLTDNHADLDVEIAVLRDRLKLEG